MHVFDGNRIWHIWSSKINRRSIDGTCWIFFHNGAQVDLKIKLRVILFVVWKRYFICFECWYRRPNFMNWMNPSSRHLSQIGKIYMCIFSFSYKCPMSLRHILINDLEFWVVRSVINIIFLNPREVNSRSEVERDVFFVFNRRDRALVDNLVYSTNSLRIWVCWSHVVERDSSVFL